ncbi:MAG: serine hydroxymethyltransferase [Thermoplasmata archaeon]
MNEEIKSVIGLVDQHHAWFENSLCMIASENLISPLAREMLVSDFGDRYAEGLPGKRYYNGLVYFDQVETKCMELARKVFDAKYADVRPTSATVANIGVLFALTKPGDIISVPNLADGAHISTAKFGAVGVRGLNPVTYPFDIKNMNIDIDATIKVLKAARPKVCLFGMSVFLFPTPIKELMPTIQEIGAKTWYDGAHVLGLIAGGEFQDPLREGIDVLTGSTHKTLPGPQHGIVVSNVGDEEFQKKLASGIFPGVVSNHHLHCVASLAITLAETLEFGKVYAKQVIKNAQALGQAMYEEGLDVLCPHLGFTKSHALAVNVSKHGGGKLVSDNLERANIIANKNMLHGDTKPMTPSGIRLGTQELTRIGLKEKDMKDVAKLLKKVIIDQKDPNVVKKEVTEFRKGFKKIHYCFDKGVDPYKRFKLVQ